MFDRESDSEVEKIRLRNLITQKKARMYGRLRKECTGEMMRQFRAKTQALFRIVATVMLDESNNEKTSNFLYQRLLSKFTKPSKNRQSSDEQPGSKTLFSKEFTSDGLADQFNGFVWNKACQKMGRPEKSLVDYQQESADKIAAWELQL